MIPTIGLEVHTQLATRTKIFCACAVEFGAPPNSRACPVCLGLPGVLPVLNREVFRLGLRAVLALKGTPSAVIRFDRKNYFYPDLPKAYQISQYAAPLGQGGFIEIASGEKIKKIRLNRLHLEEDAGKLIHDQSPDTSHVDLNRAGTPLAEIVSEPDLESAEEAVIYLTGLKAILKAIGVSDCDMEKGHLRCDANVSVRKTASDPLGKKVEIKNLNSFRAVKLAIQYEIRRQSEALEKGEPLFQETRLWDEARQKTFTMRSKEEAHDYRYFPEPDLVPFSVSAEEIEKERKALPELPAEKKERFVREYRLSAYDAGLLTQDLKIAELFEEAARIARDNKTVANWITGPVFSYLNEKGKAIEDLKLTPALLSAAANLVKEGKVSLQVAKEKIFPEMAETGRAPEAILKEKGLAQVSDDPSLEEWVVQVLKEHPKVVDDFKSGKETAAMFLVGQVMRKSRGKANPGRVQELIRRKLKADRTS
ncbi:MAG: Asp-tRNA(Asn)/Glu-tRNA(Gln) amidotransferase subunit GatB [Candidatus Omnitrophica bacterium]|nr:Asp-tRNA(Asn)/Glu-tRNA(Gln) amidotransferase subunit GatB [Candidatus Omnitrophota bacterium]